MDIAQATSTTQERLRRILLLALLALALVLAAGLALAAFAASAVDRTVADREQALLERTIARRNHQLVEDLTSATIWDDAYLAVAPRFDGEWADTNFGVYYAQYLHHSRTLAVDGQDRLIYASQAGEMTKPEASSRFAADLAPLMDRVRVEERRRDAAGGPRLVGFDGVITKHGIVGSEGSVWLVAVSTVTPETTEVANRPGPAVIVATARRLDPQFLRTLEEDLGLKALTLARSGTRTSPPRVELKDINGHSLGQLVWAPEHPGLSVLRDAAPVALLVLVLFSAVTASLARRVSGALRALTANEAALERTLGELTIARDQAQAASVAKSQFLANISHEIRTPLNGVLGMAQIMDYGELTPAQRERLDIIRTSGQSLLGLLNSVLDLAKIEAGKLEIHKSRTDLEPLLKSACAPFEALAGEKGLGLSVVVAAEAAGAWMLDGARLGQVISNLVSNAVKFTERGGVTVTASVSGSRLLISVQDTGQGIAPADVAGLFEKFNQLDASNTRQHGGSGLGLAISRELVELMGGTIGVDSVPGLGACFRLSLPAERDRVRGGD